MPDVDVLLVSVGATTGWRAAARELQAAFSLAGARAQTAHAGSVAQVRTYPALALARGLDPRLVSDDLAGAMRRALDDPVDGYAERAAALLEPFGRTAVAATLSERVLPRLLPGWRT